MNRLEPLLIFEKINPDTPMPATLSSNVMIVVMAGFVGSDGCIGIATTVCGISGQKRALREMITGADG